MEPAAIIERLSIMVKLMHVCIKYWNPNSGSNEGGN